MAATFRTSIYEHYKGGFYTALGLVIHHETRREMVLYISHLNGKLNVRPLVGWEGDMDGWADELTIGGTKRPRFRHVADVATEDLRTALDQVTATEGA